jgi:phosphoribosylaminoimidazole-succinocarboxamide synthase
LEIPGFRHIYSGKVRELYEPLDENFSHLVLIIATDRVSAFDQILSPEIPGKGANLTALTGFWFDYLPDVNHSSNELSVPVGFEDRGVIAKRLEMYPIECVVRGYLSGSGWLEYQETGAVCGIELPEGLGFGDRLPYPIFTPAFKAAQGEHDENISFEKTIELVGVDVAEQLRDTSISIFLKASQRAARAGLILADTKFEFGNDPRTNLLTLGDEVLTPDSSRYWSKELWDQGVRDQSFDKQIIRNWLSENWDKQGDIPELPAEIVAETALKYELLKKLITSVS